MIFRLSNKLQTRFGLDGLLEAPAHANPFADWSCHLFVAIRKQFILLTNTSSLYSCVMPARGIIHGSFFVIRAIDTIRGFTADDGKQLLYRKYIAPEIGKINFAMPSDSSVIGSITDHVMTAQQLLHGGMPASEVGYRLNETPMLALRRFVGRKSGIPKNVFAQMRDE